MLPGMMPTATLAKAGKCESGAAMAGGGLISHNVDLPAYHTVSSVNACLSC